MTTNNETKQGVIFAILAYVMWGMAPLYFKQLNQVPAYEILAHRAVWSCILIAVLLSLFKLWPMVKSVLSVPKNVLLLICTSLLISVNWLTYIWAVNNDHLLDASLGYFINPIINVFLGMVFLSEKLRKLQWVAILLAVIGILIQVITLGYLPWVALVLSCTFGFYGLLRKKLRLNALVGLLIETIIMLPIAATYLFIFADSATSDLSANSMHLNLLLLSAAFVTTIPLLCFNHAAVRLPLSTLGFFQYIGPTLIFILGVTLYDEVVNTETLLTFVFIWIGLVVFSIDGFKNNRHQRARLKS
ncbi:EamA family transporter RarD [Moritella viscosa]|uniref:EamA family transporter RarD n=1 Tax=Moritella viscosa TaxID=80854 RepID=UPI000911368D|nr:EamA family transporter RarD [Moritella viscosa]SGY98593.1 RarD protein [Moritella viscosa]SGY99022.1 RarD protein [Moritella viscosa]